jgi:hypothetical protein
LHPEYFTSSAHELAGTLSLVLSYLAPVSLFSFHSAISDGHLG